MSHPLQDLLVLETAGVLAGPAVGMFFAECGARVVKVENVRAGGDVTRTWKVPSEDPNAAVSAYFSSVNWGKEHLMLDLQVAKDRQRFDVLLTSADVLITNHMEASSEKLGLQRERLVELNPELIHGHIRGWRTDPHRPAFDVVLQAEMGYISMTGTEEHPAKLPVAMIDVLAAHQLKEGLLIALLHKERTGRGAFVEVSLEEAAISGLVNQAANHLMADHTPKPMGTLHPNIAPYGELFSCMNGERIVLAVGSDTQFAALCHVLELDYASTDPRFATGPARVRSRQALAELLSPAIGSRERRTLMEKLRSAGVPAGALRSVDQVLADDTARSMLLESVIDGMVTTRVRGNAFHCELR